MISDIDSPARRKLIWLIFLGLSVRVVMPAGYMPAPIGEGGPFVLCPGSMSAASLFLAGQPEAHDHHGSTHGGQHDPQQQHQQHHEPDSDSRSWESCPFGAVFGSTVIDVDTASAIREPERNLVSTHALPTSRTAPLAFHARAPPSLTSRFT